MKNPIAIQTANLIQVMTDKLSIRNVFMITLNRGIVGTSGTSNELLDGSATGSLFRR